MAFPGKHISSSLPNMPQIKRSISIRSATTTDGFTIFANKHYTYNIECGTLKDAIQNGYITSKDANKARYMKARHIALEIIENNRRKLDIREEHTEHNIISILHIDATEAINAEIVKANETCQINGEEGNTEYEDEERQADEDGHAGDTTGKDNIIQ